jgi:beta-lactamase regulating signal transducer with metallopeptidase domain
MDLTFLQHSILLSALGNAILNSLWQGLILYIIYETIQIFYNNQSAKIKHNVSLLFIFCSFTWFIGTFISKLFISDKNFTLISESTPANAPIHAFSPVREFLLYADTILPYLSVAYIFLLLFLTIKLFLAYGNVYFISNKNLINAPSHLEIFSIKVAAQIGISRKIKIWLSHHVEVPATIGFIKPIILIPFASVNHLTVAQLEAIILHELSHIKRNDYLINLMIAIIETILFFNPFIVLFIKIIKRERENCCDDFVLQYQYDAHSYASALLQLEQSRTNHVQFALGAVSGKKQLLSRIKRIMGTAHSSHFNYGQKLLTLLIITGVFFSLAYIIPSSTKNERQKFLALNNESKISGLSQVDKMPQTATSNGTTNDEPQKLNSTKKKIEINTQKNKQVDQNIISSHAEIEAPSPLSVSPHEHNSNVSDFENFPEIPINNPDVNIDYNQINDAVKQAYREIHKIDWENVQKDIHKSLSNLKLEQLPEKTQNEIKIAIKSISRFKIEKSQFDALKFVQEIQMQRMMKDSLRAAGATLRNQRAARLAADESGKLKRLLKDSTFSFSLNFNDKLVEINYLKLRKPNRTLSQNTHRILRISE